MGFIVQTDHVKLSRTGKIGAFHHPRQSDGKTVTIGSRIFMGNNFGFFKILFSAPVFHTASPLI